MRLHFYVCNSQAACKSKQVLTQYGCRYGMSNKHGGDCAPKSQSPAPSPLICLLPPSSWRLPKGLFSTTLQGMQPRYVNTQHLNTSVMMVPLKKSFFCLVHLMLHLWQKPCRITQNGHLHRHKSPCQISVTEMIHRTGKNQLYLSLLAKTCTHPTSMQTTMLLSDGL